MEKIKEEVLGLKEEVIFLRRKFHEQPELGFEEYRTSKFVSEYLKKLGIEVKEGIAKTGVVGFIKGKEEGNTVLLRADMDALPIQEMNEIPYKSKVQNVMHACGHDGHTAILLVAAKILQSHKEELKGNVKLVFQPSEEKDPGGAIKMIDEGVLENPKVNFAYGLHLGSIFERGKIVTRKGIFMAQADRFKLKVTGKGGHGAYPHQTIDPILILSHIIVALQEIVSRETNPLESVVLSFGKISSGDVFNVIPESAEAEGTVRTLSSQKAKEVRDMIERIGNNIAGAFRGKFELEYNFGYPPLINNTDQVEFLKEIVKQTLGEDSLEEAPISMGGEDMSYFLERVPGVFFWLGAKNEEKGIINPHHSPYFNIDEEVLPIGVELLVNIAIKSLENSK